MSAVAEFVRILHEHGATRARISAALGRLDPKEVPFCRAAALLISYENVSLETALELLDAIEADRQRYLNIAINWNPPKAYARAPRTKKYGPAQDPDTYFSAEKLRAYNFAATFELGDPVARPPEKEWWPLVGQVFRRDGFICTYCGADGEEFLLHCDHIVPISRGGPNEIENLTTSCDYCNCAKRDALPHEWRPLQAVPQ